MMNIIGSQDRGDIYIQ